MFSKTITNSSKFLRQPATAQQLYFHLGMNGDDDGFVEWYTVITMTRTSEQDLQVLSVNGFVQVLDDKVLLVKDWKENNFIRPDRYQPSKYLETYKEQLGKDLVYQIDTVGIPSDIPLVNQRYTEVRLELGKVSTGNLNTLAEVEKSTPTRSTFLDKLGEDTRTLWLFWEETFTEIVTSLEDNRSALNKLLALEGSTEKVRRLILLAAKAWSEPYTQKEVKVSSPKALWEKRATLLAWGKGKFMHDNQPLEEVG